MTNIKLQLQSLGFTENEALIYLTLIKGGSMKAGLIIQRTKLQRSVVYTCLNKLIFKELVIGKRALKVAEFQALNPEKLIDLQKDTVFKAEVLARELKKEKLVNEREVFIYEGDDIVMTVAERSLKSSRDSTVYFLGPSKFGAQKYLEKSWQKYHKKREMSGVHARILYEQFTPQEIIDQRNTYKTCKARYLPIDVEVPISFTIWENNVAIILPGENPPFVFFIKNTSTAETLVEYFNFMWRQSKSKQV